MSVLGRFLLVVTCFLPLLSSAQAPPPAPVNFHYALNDNGPDAIQSFFDVDFSWKVGGEEQDKEGRGDIVNWNKCKGKVHFAHEQCDLSCDERDLGLKKYRIPPAPIGDEISGNFYDQATADSKKFGFPDVFTALLKGDMENTQKIMDGQQYVAKGEMPAWNEKACTKAIRSPIYKRYTLHVKYRFYRLSPDGKGGQFPTNGPTKESDLWEVLIPVPGKFADSSQVLCACAVLKEQTGTGENPEHSSAVKPVGEQQYAGLYTGPSEQSFIPTTTLESCNFTVSCPDMNRALVTAMNPTTMPLTIYIGPGTEFDPDEDDYQDMILITPITLQLAPKTWTRIPLTMSSDGSLGGDSAEGRVLCINLHKKQPEARVHYRVRLPKSDALAKMAAYTAKERVRGNWTQTRFWIVSDAATYDDVQKVLLPAPSKGLYLRSLYEAATQAGLDMSDPKFAACAQPELLTGGASTLNSSRWLIRTLSQTGRSGELVSWLGSNHEALSQLLGDSSVDRERQHYADLVHALCMAGEVSLKTEGLALATAVPEARRAEFVKFGGLTGVAAILLSDDQALVAKAVDVAALYRSPELVVPLFNLNAAISADVKAAAKKIASETKLPNS